MRVKICGITRPDDARIALDSGADALGFVVGSPASPRNVSLAEARKLMKSIPVFTSKVAVTSAGDYKTIKRICSTLNPDAVQLHRYTADLLQGIRENHPETELILATGIQTPSIALISPLLSFGDAVLADTPSHNGLGGTGRTHDWKLSAKLRDSIQPRPLILAGGLTLSNIKAAIKAVRPYAVDVSSGVEKRPGVKDHVKVREFIRRAKAAPT